MNVGFVMGVFTFYFVNLQSTKVRTSQKHLLAMIANVESQRTIPHTLNKASCVTVVI